MSPYGDVHAVLMAELEDARQRYIAAIEQFDAIRSAPEGQRGVTIQMAERHKQVAAVAYRDALKRFHDFILDELVPDDLRETRE